MVSEQSPARRRLKPPITSVIVIYVVLALVWLVVTTPFVWDKTHHPLLLTSIRALSLVATGILIAYSLQRTQALRTSKSEYTQLFGNLLEPVMIHTNGLIVDANLHAVEFFEGASKTDLMGQPILRFVHPTDVNAAQQRIAQLQKGKSTKLREETFITLTGKLREVEIAGIPVIHDGKPAVMVIFRDITERKRVQRALSESESRLRTLVHGLMESREQYRSLFENDADMIAWVDLNGIIVSANPATEATVGFTPDELVGRCYRDLITPENHEASQIQFESVMTGHRQLLNTTLIRQDGRRIEVCEKKVPMLIDDKVKGFFWLIRDVSASKAAEEMLIQSERLAAVGQMAAGIAHEIRNPLTALKGFVQLMRSAEDVKDLHLTVMKDELERIESIVNELLIYAKPTSMVLQPDSLNRLIQDVMELLSPHASLRGVQMSVQFDSQVPKTILCDKNRLKQVLVNLVKNAIEAMPQGGEVNMIIRSVDRKFVSVCVSDTGAGIPDEVLTHMGEPFYTTKQGGTGLGLSVSRRIVEAHHGTLHIRSELGKGTEAEMILPTNAVADHPPTNAFQ